MPDAQPAVAILSLPYALIVGLPRPPLAPQQISPSHTTMTGHLTSSHLGLLLVPYSTAGPHYRSGVERIRRQGPSSTRTTISSGSPSPARFLLSRPPGDHVLAAWQFSSAS
jgi:hypothetical protein